MADQKNSNKSATEPYLVLARKYRPKDFSDLVGQDAMVQTFDNAFKSGRIHHAFILTGVRGVGKTTTARILARAFNYQDENSKRPTLDIKKPGVHCQSIIAGRHVDVIEMDAASNTGIDDIREIIDSVKYAPASAPYKVYIIDEVHMLSKQAFNGLLKTLEEPPPYVKFIFATTEIRKVPVTILSRCQRFDLRRISAPVMLEHLTSLLALENIEHEADALAMIIRAGEGSVRDCLSLADQAIAHGGGKITAASVKTMLGLADRAKTIDLFEALLGGNIALALELARNLYDVGVDPSEIIADLSRFTHLVSRMKVVADTFNDPSITPDEKTRGKQFCEQLGMRILTRTWQILQGGLREIASASNAIQALEMVLIRLAHAADLPTPDELIKSRQSNPPAGSKPATVSQAPAANTPSTSYSPPHPAPANGHVGAPVQSFSSVAATSVLPATAIVSDVQDQKKSFPNPTNFAELVALAGQQRDLAIKHALETQIRPISFVAGHMEIALTDGADKTIISTLSSRLKQWTGQSWLVSLSNPDARDREKIPKTLREKKANKKAALFAAARKDEMVQAVLETFTDAQLVEVNEVELPQNFDSTSQIPKNKGQDEE